MGSGVHNGKLCAWRYEIYFKRFFFKVYIGLILHGQNSTGHAEIINPTPQIAMKISASFQGGLLLFHTN